jgi:uncharacterized membrane protein
MRIANMVVLAVIIFSFVLSMLLYPHMPDQMPMHWNTAGEVDSYMPKFWGLFLLPLISVGILLLFIAIPRVDPLKRNIEKFRSYFDGFIVLIILFMFYVYLLTIFWSVNITYNMTQMLMPALAVLFFYIGVLVGKTKRNWFIGIRTPWTLSSDKVWERTHSRGGKLFMAVGVITFFATFSDVYAIWMVLVPILTVVAYLFVFSYFEYQKETKK